MTKTQLTVAIVGMALSAVLGGMVGSQSHASPETKFVPSFIYADLAEAREDATHYSCTDIIGVPDGYRLEVLPNAACGKPLPRRTEVCTDRSGNVFVNPREDECQDFKEITWQ